jgi:hypothetical protein
VSSPDLQVKTGSRLQTTGVVAFAKGLPFSKVQVGKQSIGYHRVQVKSTYLADAKAAMRGLVANL